MKSLLMSLALLLALAAPAGLAWSQDQEADTPAPGQTGEYDPADSDSPPPPDAEGQQDPDQQQDGNQQQNGDGGPRNPFDTTFFIIVGAGFVLLIWWQSRSRKKQEQRRREVLSALKKGDKITTIGGIVGTIVEMRDNEVIVKVDESNNIRMRFLKDAIRPMQLGGERGAAGTGGPEPDQQNK